MRKIRFIKTGCRLFELCIITNT
uniref:Uncharacterized protein n=1 Tax=Anguilla anguilla TaxID=7936 RepID=A0A0E9XC10_ANGAN